MDAFKRAVDALFRDPNLAVDATYRSRFFVKAVRVIERRPDQVVGFDVTRVATETTLVQVRVSEIAEPEEGDEIELGDRTVKVKGTPLRLDPLALVWTLDNHPV